jgi:predicted MFS family arabinose efflux permease
VLFLGLFAAQSAAIVLTPVLRDVARDLGVSTATAGQLRTIAALSAGITAVVLALLRRRPPLRGLLGWGTAVLASGSLAGALAPSFVSLAAAHVTIGVGTAVLLTAATAAAAEWVPEEHRSRVLSWALLGSPAAWIVGMPVIGALGELDWRYAWLALPFTASALAAIGLSRRPRTSAREQEGSLTEALRDSLTRRWLLSELAANAAWIGLLVYVGSLFRDSYGSSASATGVLLAVAAAAYVVGNMAASRLHADPVRVLVGLGLVLAVLVALVGALRPSVTVSIAVLSAAAAAAGARTLVGSGFGLTLGRCNRVAVMGARAATTQFGFFAGAAAGGGALALGGYPALGVVLGSLFAASALPLSRVRLAAPRDA